MNIYEESSLVLDDLSTEQAEHWQITNDNLADWAVRKVKEEKEEYRRIYQIAEEQINDIETRLEAAEKRCESRTSYLTGKLREYFEHVPHKETKTQEQYQLLSGKLVWKKPQVSIEKDDASLLAYLKASENQEYIKTEEKPMWAEFKKTIGISGNQAVSVVTGEVIDCLTVIEKPGKFEVN